MWMSVVDLQVRYRAHNSLVNKHIHHNQITFLGLEFWNFKIFGKKYVLTFFEMIKIIEDLVGFELMTCRFLVKTL